jgi:excisionase family DNA binding protein
MAIERRYFKASEMAEYLGLHPKSIYRAIARRQIPAVKMPGIGIRVDKKKLETMLERGELERGRLGKA